MGDGRTQTSKHTRITIAKRRYLSIWNSRSEMFPVLFSAVLKEVNFHRIIIIEKQHFKSSLFFLPALALDYMYHAQKSNLQMKVICTSFWRPQIQMNINEVKLVWDPSFKNIVSALTRVKDVHLCYNFKDTSCKCRFSLVTKFSILLQSTFRTTAYLMNQRRCPSQLYSDLLTHFSELCAFFSKKWEKNNAISRWLAIILSYRIHFLQWTGVLVLLVGLQQ